MSRRIGRPSSASSSTSSSSSSQRLRPIDTSRKSSKKSSEEHQPLVTDSSVSSSSSDSAASSKLTSGIKTRHRSISPHSRSRGILRSLSRSRSRSRSSKLNQKKTNSDDDDDDESVGSATSSTSSSSLGSSAGGGGGGSGGGKQILVAVTSCRSDAYHAQKALGSTSVLPRKAPSALKTFHELAVGIKDAYEAVGSTPHKPDLESEEYQSLSKEERNGEKVLWEFMENLNMLLALVDEVASDTAQRGVLKEDSSFKGIRDVIKKVNKILEKMLIRKENKHTLFFRITQSADTKEIVKIDSWNKKCERAMSSVGQSNNNNQNGGSSTKNTDKKMIDAQNTDAASIMSESTEASSASNSSKGGMFRRGRGLLSSTAGKVRARRATPTPRLRSKFKYETNDKSSSADDGYAATTAPAPITPGNLEKLQQSLSSDGENKVNIIPGKFSQSQPAGVPSVQPMAPKDELVDVIRVLRSEKISRETSVTPGVQPEDLQPNWLPKANIPLSVPKLPVEYIHRHRLMKQVVNSLLGRPGVGARENEIEPTGDQHITSITSRHADKAGNGKTTLAVAAIQTVEIRERFADGIAWIQLGRTPLTDKDVRRLYEEIYDQLLSTDKETTPDDKMNDIFANNPVGGGGTQNSGAFMAGSFPVQSKTDQSKLSDSEVSLRITESRRRYQGGDLEGMKEDLGRVLSSKRVLLVLDDVWRLDDAKRFIFNTDKGAQEKKGPDACPYHVLITTRTPQLLGSEAHEVYVRIFSEHEAVKLLLFAAGRRLNGGKSSPVFNEARIIVKGCGNSPLALRLAGGMLRTGNRNWTLSSLPFLSLVDQCRSSLEEASRIRSFVNSVLRIVDLSFVSVPNVDVRVSLRRCFVTFAMVFHNNDWALSGKGIPREVVLNLFSTVISTMDSKDNVLASPDTTLDMLENLNLLMRARHGDNSTTQCSHVSSVNSYASKSLFNGSMTTNDSTHSTSVEELFAANSASTENASYVMHESIKHIAEEMSTRSSLSFAPKPDEFTSFKLELQAEKRKEETSKTQSQHWLSNATTYLFNTQSSDNNDKLAGHQFHEVMISSLNESDIDGQGSSLLSSFFTENKQGAYKPHGGEKVLKYNATFLPSHLIRAKMLTNASSLLTDENFVKKRVSALGPVQASYRHVGDMLELRREYIRSLSSDDKSPSKFESSSGDEKASRNTYGVQQETIDIDKVQREASQLIKDTVFNTERQTSDSKFTINMAICLSTIGESLLKTRQYRDAMIRLEEAVEIYKNLPNEYDVGVAMIQNSIAKIYSKLGDSRAALLKLAQAERIYESMNATMHHDAIANSHFMATLFVESAENEIKE